MLFYICVHMPVVLFRYNACIIAKYDTSMRLINEVHNMQTRYKTDYNMPKISTKTMRSLFTYSISDYP